MARKRAARTATYDLRVKAVSLVHTGVTQREVARRLQVSPSTVSKWMARFAAGGGNALRTERPRGRPARLSYRKLAETVGGLPRSEGPFRPGGGAPTSPEIARRLASHSGVRVTPRHVRRMLRTAALRTGDNLRSGVPGVKYSTSPRRAPMTAPVEIQDSADLFAAVRARDLAGVQALILRDPRLARQADPEGMTPLLTAAYYRAPEVVSALLAAGAEPDVFAASALGLDDRLTLLLTARSDLVRAVSSDGWTPLHLAAHFGRVSSILLLLGRGGDLAAVSKNAMENQPLQAATASGEADAVRVLIATGAKVDVRSHGQFTALHIAAANGDLPCVRLLCGAGAERAPRLENGATPADLAEAKGHSAVVAFLRGG